MHCGHKTSLSIFIEEHFNVMLIELRNAISVIYVALQLYIYILFHKLIVECL